MIMTILTSNLLMLLAFLGCSSRPVTGSLHIERHHPLPRSAHTNSHISKKGDYYHGYGGKGGKASDDDYYYSKVKSGKSYYDGYYRKYKSGKTMKSEGKDKVFDEYYRDYKSSGKTMKSGGKGYDDDYYYYHYEKGGKSMKYSKKEKKEKQYYYDGEDIDDTIIHDENFYSKSKKSDTFPDFEYIEIGYKSWKDSKERKSYKYGYECEDNDGCDYSEDYGKGYYSGKGSKSGKSAYYSAYYSKSYSKIHKEEKPNKPKPGTSNDVPPSMRPPLAPTESPAPISPSSTPPPTNFGTFAVGVPEFTLAYQLLNGDAPKTEELKELEDATGKYLTDFFVKEFEPDDFTEFDTLISTLIDYSYNNVELVVVSYDAISRFDVMSTITPSPDQLASLVTEAFTGLNMLKYEDALNEILPKNNIFAGSEIQFYQGEDVISDTSRWGIRATSIAASAVAFTLLAAGFVIYKRRSDGRENVTDKLNKAPGDITVAGETFAGETYDGTASVSANSLDCTRRCNDEEEGTKTDNLGSIPENGDADSVTPMWSGEDEDLGRTITASVARSAFRGSGSSALRTAGEVLESRTMSASFEDVALQAPTPGGFQDYTMPDPSSSEDDTSQMSDSELSQFVASKQGGNQTYRSNTLEIKSLLSMDSLEEKTPSISSGLSVRDNSSRRLRTVAEIEALLSSDLKDPNTNPFLGGYKTGMQGEQLSNRPRTVEEIESLLTADDDDTIVELPFSDEDESIIE